MRFSKTASRINSNSQAKPNITKENPLADHASHSKKQQILAWQKTFGNQVMGQFLAQPSALQTKMTVNPPGEAYEREADAVAQHVLKQSPNSMNTSVESTPPLESNTESTLQAASGGRPLPDRQREPLEQSFGFSFGQVNVHTNQRADLLNRSINANAFTIGRDIFFRKGLYAPSQPSGQRLLAHELTHVVQQSGGQPHSASMSPSISPMTSHTASIPIQRELKVGSEDTIDDDGLKEHMETIKPLTKLYDKPGPIMDQLEVWASEFDEHPEEGFFADWAAAVAAAAVAVGATLRDEDAENAFRADPEVEHADAVEFNEVLDAQAGSSEWWTQQLETGKNELEQQVFAGHGYRKPWETDTTVVPEGTTVVFYVYDEIPLPQSESNIVEGKGVDPQHAGEVGADWIIMHRLRDITPILQATGLSPEAFLASASGLSPENFSEAVYEKITEDFESETGLTKVQFLASAKGQAIDKERELEYHIHPEIVKILREQGKSLFSLRPAASFFETSDITPELWDLQFKRLYGPGEQIYNYTVTPSKDDDVVLGTPVRLPKGAKRKKLAQFLKPNLGVVHLAICREIDWWGGFAELMPGNEIHQMPDTWKYTKAKGYIPPGDWTGPKNPNM